MAVKLSRFAKGSTTRGAGKAVGFDGRIKFKKRPANLDKPLKIDYTTNRKGADVQCVASFLSGNCISLKANDHLGW